MPKPLNQIWSSIRNLIKRGAVTRAGKDAGTFPTTQVTYLEKTGEAESFTPYGLSSNLPVGSIVILLNNQGNEDNKIALGYKPDIRFKNLKEGEVVVGNPVANTYVYFKQDGSIEITAQQGITVNASQAIVNADTTINGDLLVNGKIEATGDLTALKGTGDITMSAIQSTYNTHTHDENGTGGGTTNAPNQPI